jgi:hypothetical protein
MYIVLARDDCGRMTHKQHNSQLGDGLSKATTRSCGWLVGWLVGCLMSSLSCK